MSKHFRVPGRLPARLQELGIRLPLLLQSTGLPPRQLHQPRIFVTTEELFALWRAIGQASPNPAIGLELGTEVRAENFDPIALAALSTASFGEAMRQMARYKRLSCPEEIFHQTDDIEWSIQFRWLLANDSEPEVLTDLCFAWVLCVARRGTGTRLTPLRLELARPPAHEKILRRHFGCPIVFGSARNAIVFRASDAALAILDPERRAPGYARTPIRPGTKPAQRPGDLSGESPGYDSEKPRRPEAQDAGDRA
jgi:hypothetical protein